MWEEEPGVRKEKRGVGEGGEGSARQRGSELHCRLLLLWLGHSSLQTLNLCISWGLPPAPAWQLCRAQTTTARHRASSPLSHTQHGWLHLEPSPSTELSSHQGCGQPLCHTALQQDGTTQGSAPLTPVGWTRHTAQRCQHNRRVMEPMGRAGHAVEVRWVAGVGRRKHFLTS